MLRRYSALPLQGSTFRFGDAIRCQAQKPFTSTVGSPPHGACCCASGSGESSSFRIASEGSGRPTKTGEQVPSSTPARRLEIPPLPPNADRRTRRLFREIAVRKLLVEQAEQRIAHLEEALGLRAGQTGSDVRKGGESR